MQMIITTGQKTINRTDRLRLFIPLLHISSLHKRPLFIEQVKGHTFLFAERNVFLDLLHIKTALLQQLFDCRSSFRAQCIHQKNTQEPIHAEFLQGRNHRDFFQFLRPAQRFPDAKKLFVTIQCYHRYPGGIQYIE